MAGTSMPETRYARSGDVNIAYQVLGTGPPDLILVEGYLSHLELAWESPLHAQAMERLASFSRVVTFDKRGVGMSDPVDELPTLEQRMDDVRLVMDEVGSERATLMGISEGSMMCMLFAATHPQRTDGLILYGAMARATEAPDYPWATPREALLESMEMSAEHWGEGGSVEIFAPSLADIPLARESAAKLERYAAPPRAAQKLHEMFLDLDVRHVLPAIGVPTLVLHRRGDRAVNVRAGRWLASQIEGARYVELDGIDHLITAGDTDELLEEIQEFMTGTRHRPEPERILATVMFTDIVDSSGRASTLGDARWLELLDLHHALVRRELDRCRGHEVKTLGDGFLATFDGPARAIGCAVSISREAEAAGIPVRIGLHTGEYEVHEDDVGGIAVNIAARVSAKAAGNECWCHGPSVIW